MSQITTLSRIRKIFTAKPLYIIFSGLFLSACSVTSPKMNEPLKAKSSSELSALGSESKNQRSDELSLFMAFSGGGTRSAALSYGVLKKLRDTKINIGNKQRRLLDEVDMISSVSGGSFTSAYYGLFGDGIFKDFEKKVLKRKIQTELLNLSLFSPKSWIRLAPALFERSDLAAEYYHQTIFKKKHFGDMRPDAPFIVINATDLSLGQGFSFTGYHFSWICSDLNSYPISRAVAASSAVPVVFSPITLENHAGSCKFSPIVWDVQKRNRNKVKNKQKRYKDALRVKNYRDNKKLKYLHLVDGGVADNLGIRSILDIISFHNDSMWSAMKTYGMQNTKKMVFISVNAASFQNPVIATRKRAPSTVDVIDTTTTIQSNKYNTETIDLLTSKFPVWKKQVQTARCREKPSKDCANIEFQLIEINLEDLRPSELKALGIVPTALELPNKTVDQLEDAGMKLMQRSKSFQTFINGFK
ncbi:patatin-like phospholipase family protein [Cocleimonas sp. KMM 6892]|nr:patatin-like phospholipase family protein [Cocleimonas sp. KMM 6892]